MEFNESDIVVSKERKAKKNSRDYRWNSRWEKKIPDTEDQQPIWK